MRKYIIAIILCCFMTSCIKDEAQNQECDIESAWIEGEQYEQNFYQTSEMRKDNINSSEVAITFTVRSMLSLPRQIPVSFRITDGATIEPASGSMQDFTQGPITYTVTSQDRQWKRTYKVSFTEPVLPKNKFSFENIAEITGGNMFGSSYEYHQFFDYDQNGEEQNFWASGNAGFALTCNGSVLAYGFPTFRAENGYEGHCACMQTLSTGALGQLVGKPIAAGNLFLGKFNADMVLKDPLKTTQFGVAWDREPVRITGYYRYLPGKEFINKDMTVIPDRTDEASIYAVFYRKLDEKGKTTFLYGDDVEDLDRLMDHPLVYKVASVASLPPTNEWTPFEMFFEGKDAPDDMVARKDFNLAIVFSSSLRGAQFEGAIGSMLFVDEVEVSFEK